MNIHVFSLFGPTHSSGWPKLLWFVTESKHLSKPPRDWFPHIKDANNDTAYIEVSLPMELCPLWKYQFIQIILPAVHAQKKWKPTVWDCFSICCTPPATLIVLWYLIGRYSVSRATEINISYQHAGHSCLH